jgi:hypothetical protein
MTWLYQGSPILKLPDDCVGFVYVITNRSNNKKYIGKKLAKFAKTTYKMVLQKNGKKVKKKIRSKVDSDWQEYYGSSDALTKDIEKVGKQYFRREILYFCQSKAQCSYLEAKEQFSRGVLESSNYYNGQISVRVHGSHILGKL